MSVVNMQCAYMHIYRPPENQIMLRAFNSSEVLLFLLFFFSILNSLNICLPAPFLRRILEEENRGNFHFEKSGYALLSKYLHPLYMLQRKCWLECILNCAIGIHANKLLSVYRQILQYHVFEYACVCKQMMTMRVYAM